MHMKTSLMVASPLGVRNNKRKQKNPRESRNDEGGKKDVLSACFFCSHQHQRLPFLLSLVSPAQRARTPG